MEVVRYSRIAGLITLLTLAALCKMVAQFTPFKGRFSAQSSASDVAFFSGCVVRYISCSTGLVATRSSYVSARNSFWHRLRSEYANSER